MTPYQYIYSNQSIIVKIVDPSQNNGFNALPCKSGANGIHTPTNNTKGITLFSLNDAPLIPDTFYIAHQVDEGVYVTHNQAVFLEFL